MKGYLTAMIIETALFVTGTFLSIWYLYNRKHLHIIKLRKDHQRARNLKILSDPKISKLQKITDVMAFILAVLSREDLQYSERNLKKVLIPIVFIDITIIFLITVSSDVVMLSCILLLFIHMFLFMGIYEFCRYVYSKDLYTVIDNLQNEIIRNNEIIKTSKSAVGKMKKSMVASEIDRCINDMTKNLDMDAVSIYEKYIKKTFDHGLSMVAVFLLDSKRSGDNELAKKNLKVLERYFEIDMNRIKDRLFTKLPYLFIMLLLPLFMIWMDSFSVDGLFDKTIEYGPKEYVYILSVGSMSLFLSI